MYYDSVFLDDGSPGDGGNGEPDAGTTPPHVDARAHLLVVVLDALRAAIADVNARLANASGDAAVTFADGLLTLSDLYAAWLYWGMVITSGEDYGENAGGAMTGGGNDPGLTLINNTTVNGYAGYPGRTGLNFLVVHEAVHATKVATEHYGKVYDSWAASVADTSDAAWKRSAPFLANEQLVNRVTRDVLNLLQLPAIADPPLGYGE